MRTRRLSLYLVGAAIALPCQALAAPPATLKQAVDGAWRRVPDARTIEARQVEAAAARATADAWLASQPTLGLAQRRDQGGSERAQRESELSVSSSFWLPGQKAAREALAARGLDEAAAHLASTRLAVAGLVRQRLWEAAAAQVALEEKQDHLHHLEGFAAEVARRVKAGDLARADGLLADQEVLAARIEVGQARNAALDALARFQVLTGLQELPALEPEPLGEIAAPANPRLLAAQASEQRARAALRLLEQSRSAPPTVALSVRRQEERMLREPVRSLGLALQIPFGSAARNRHVEAQAHTALATAAAEAAEAQAASGAEVTVARARLANATAALEDAIARAKLMHEHTALFEKAFRQGERGLAELLRSRALTHEADVAVAQQKVAVGHAHAQLNQALGIIP